ncbi:Uncharacterised protein [Mycobacteroides abscessus subsp. abscessus]|nr:Uncharacterised protein [Mycobacteroides abscessus subsp. abscessus]
MGGTCFSWRIHSDEAETPSLFSSRPTSGTLTPITFEGSPSMPSMNQPPRPSSVKAPATCNGSPVAK